MKIMLQISYVGMNCTTGKIPFFLPYFSRCIYEEKFARVYFLRILLNGMVFFRRYRAITETVK